MPEGTGYSSAAVIAAALAGAGLGILVYNSLKKEKAEQKQERTVTPAALDSPDGFPEELSDALQVHYGSQAMKELLTDLGLAFGTDYAADCAQMCERNCTGLQDFTGEQGDATALDLGCSVGGTAFELRQIFPMVVGVDPDHLRIDLAKHISSKRTWVHRGHMVQTSQLLHAELFEDMTDPPMFLTAEPCAFLDSVTRPFDAILCANFLERAERPKAVLQRLHRALKPGGVAVIVFAWFYDAGLFPQQSDEHVVEQPSGLDKLIKDTLAKRFTFVEEHMLAMISNHHSGDFRMQLARAVIYRKSKE